MMKRQSGSVVGSVGSAAAGMEPDLPHIKCVVSGRERPCELLRNADKKQDLPHAFLGGEIKANKINPEPCLA